MLLRLETNGTGFGVFRTLFRILDRAFPDDFDAGKSNSNASFKGGSLPGRAVFDLPHFKLEMPHLLVGRRCRAAGMADWLHMPPHPCPAPPTPVGGGGESCAVFLKNPRRNWPEIHPQNQNRPLVISSWQSATQAHGRSAPEARQIVAHSETVGFGRQPHPSPPDGATENQPPDIFFRPGRGLIRFIRLTHGSRRGQLSADAPRLRTLRVLRATKPHPLFNPVRLWSDASVFRQPRPGRNLCSHAAQPCPNSVRSEIFRPQTNPNMPPLTGLGFFKKRFLQICRA